MNGTFTRTTRSIDLARYPFLNEAGQYMRETGFDIEEINRPEMESILSRATKRLETELLKGKYDESLEKYEVEILTFLISIMIIKATNMDNLIKKHSLFEARRAEKFLIQDLRAKTGENKKLLLLKIFQELFKLKVEMTESNNLFKIKIFDYIERSLEFHELEWKLINRMIDKGFVFLNVDEIVRIIRSELSLLIYSRTKTINVDSLPEKIKQKAEQIKLKIPHDDTRKFTIKEYPPCIIHAMDLLSKGENLPHSARVMLAAYLIAIGKGVEEIISIFSKAPDFNAKITTYQIEHLAGIRGSGKKYLVPSCYKLQNENLCFRTIDCKGISNPIQFKKVQQ